MTRYILNTNLELWRTSKQIEIQKHSAFENIVLEEKINNN